MPVDPSTLTPDQFADAVKAWSGQAPQTGVPQPAAPVAPKTKEAIANFSYSQAGQRMGLRPGVAFNPERGASLLTRARLSFDNDTLNQFKILSKVYGPKNIEVSPDNRFIVRDQVNPDTGTKEDFFVDPIGLEAGDIAGMTADVLPMVAGAAGMKFGGSITTRPLVGFLAKLGGMALATEATAGVEQAASRYLEGSNIAPGSLTAERTKHAVADMMIGTVFAGGAKVMEKTAAGALGLLGYEASQTEGQQAVKRLAASTGVTYPQTPGEAANSPILMRVEATAKPRIGSAGVMDLIEEGKQRAQDDLRRVFLGLPRTMTDEQVAAALPKADITGEKALGRLGTEALRLEGDVAKAKGVVEATGTKEAQAVARVNLAKPLESVPVGEAMRERAKTEFATFKSDMSKRYEAFEAQPEVTDRIISGNKLAKVGREVSDELFPQVTRQKTITSPLLDPSGTPISQTVTKTEPIDPFIASAARRAVNGLRQLEGGKVSIADIKKIRTALDNSISEGVSIPGTDVKQLVTLRDKITSTIETELRGIDPALATEWKQLSTDYSTGIKRFDKVGIRQMLVEEGKPGSIGNAELARAISSGTPGSLDRYSEFKQFFGVNSPEFQNVQRLAREHVLKGSLSETSGYVTGADLRSRLRSLDPEVAADLFGASKTELNRIGEALSVAQGNLDLGELSKLASRGNLTAAAIPDLISAERARAVAYNNKLIRAAARGTVDAEKIQPSEFVRNVTQMDPKDAKMVLGVLSDRPDLLQDIRQLAVEDLLSRASIAGKTGQAWWTSSGISEAMGSDTQKRTWEALLGSKVLDDLTTLAKAIQPQEFGTRAFRSSGQLGAATDITRLEKGGIMDTLTMAGVRMLLGTLYTGPARQMVINLANTGGDGRLLNAMIASTPFIERVGERFGEDAPTVMSMFRSIVEPKQERQLQVQGAVPGADPSKMTPEEFNTWVNRQFSIKK